MHSVTSPVMQSSIRHLKPAADVSFALIDRLPVLFSEDTQKLFELNDIAAFIWCSMQEAAPIETICKQLIDRGMSPAEARDSLRDALNQWLGADLIVPQVEATAPAFRALVGQSLIEVRASDRLILESLQSLFVATTAAGPATVAEATFAACRLDDTVIVTHDGRKAFECVASALAPTFRSYAVEHLLLADIARDMVFHAAAVTFGDQGMLISACPGTGKSTLTMHLLDLGLGFGADDIVLIGADGTIRGVPFAPTLKSGSWSLINSLRPDIDRLPVHDRQDGALIRYLDVEPSFHDGPFQVNWMIFLERSPGYPRPTLVELSEVDTLRQIIAASFASDGQLTVERFLTLKNLVSQTRSFVLRYTEAAQAAEELIGLCDGRR